MHASLSRPRLSSTRARFWTTSSEPFTLTQLLPRCLGTFAPKDLASLRWLLRPSDAMLRRAGCLAEDELPGEAYRPTAPTPCGLCCVFCGFSPEGLSAHKPQGGGELPIVEESLGAGPWEISRSIGFVDSPVVLGSRCPSQRPLKLGGLEFAAAGLTSWIYFLQFAPFFRLCGLGRQASDSRLRDARLPRLAFRCPAGTELGPPTTLLLSTFSSLSWTCSRANARLLRRRDLAEGSRELPGSLACGRKPPTGLLGLGPLDSSKVSYENCLVDCTAFVASACLDLGLPFWIDGPDTSLFWGLF